MSVTVPPVAGSGADTSGTNPTDALTTPVGSRTIYLVLAQAAFGGGLVQPSSIGGDGWTTSVTWTHMGGVASASANLRLDVYRGTTPASPTEGAVDATVSTGSDAAWIQLFQPSGALLGEAPAQAVVTNLSASGTGMSVTLGSAPNSGNTQFAVFFSDSASASTEGGGFTAGVNQDVAGASLIRFFTEYDTSAPSDGVADATNGGSTNSFGWVGLTFELDETAGGGSETGEITEDAALGASFSGVRDRAAAITEDADLGASFDALVARLGGITEDANLGASFAGLTARSDSVAAGAALAESFDAVLARLGALAEGAALGATFESSGAVTGALGADAALAATFDGLLAKLAAFSGGVSMGMSLGTAVTTIEPDYNAQFGATFAALAAYAQAWTGGATLGGSFVGETTTSLEGSIAAAVQLGMTIGTALARIAGISAGAELGASYSAALARIGAVSDSAELGATYTAALARVATTADDVALADTFAAVGAYLVAASAGAAFGASFSYEGPSIVLVPTRDRIAPSLGGSPFVRIANSTPFARTRR